MKRDVQLRNGRVIVRPASADAIARLRQLNLRKKVGASLNVKKDFATALIRRFEADAVTEPTSRSLTDTISRIGICTVTPPVTTMLSGNTLTLRESVTTLAHCTSKGREAIMPHALSYIAPLA